MVATLATLNKQMLPFLEAYDALSLVSQSPAALVLAPQVLIYAEL